VTNLRKNSVVTVLCGNRQCEFITYRI